LKAIVICQGVPGTTAAIDKVKEVRDDIAFIVGAVHEEPYMMAGKADILFAGKNLIGSAQVGEYFRVFIAYGVIGIALALHAWQRLEKNSKIRASILTYSEIHV
jgi:hypothetical protein